MNIFRWLRTQCAKNRELLMLELQNARLNLEYLDKELQCHKRFWENQKRQGLMPCDEVPRGALPIIDDIDFWAKRVRRLARRIHAPI